MEFWQGYADELVSLQANGSVKIGFYDETFSDWDGYILTELPDTDELRQITKLLINRGVI